MAKRNSPTATPPRPQIEVIDPRWLLKAGGLILVVALFFAWLTLCGLFYQGQWQFALHPSRTVPSTPEVSNLPFEPIRFGVDASGTPQLSGWWIPSDSPNAPTALVLHSADGSISDALPTAQRLHTARLNVLLFDYRGFGQSGGQHPTEDLMHQDAVSAFDYLTVTRQIPAVRVIPVGLGIGASLAAGLSAQHPEIPAVILDAPAGDIESSVAHDPRTHMIPTAMLLHEHFPLAAPLAVLKTPKLIINYTHGAAPLDLRQAASPKMTVELPNTNDVLYVQTFNRFLDQYVSSPIPSLPQPQ